MYNGSDFMVLALLWMFIGSITVNITWILVFKSLHAEQGKGDLVEIKVYAYKDYIKGILAGLFLGPIILLYIIARHLKTRDRK